MKYYFMLKTSFEKLSYLKSVNERTSQLVRSPLFGARDSHNLICIIPYNQFSSSVPESQLRLNLDGTLMIQNGIQLPCLIVKRLVNKKTKLLFSGLLLGFVG